MTTFEELKIPVIYGHFAGKQWGPKAGIKVLAIHGWLDNACSFDNLAELLSGDTNFVALDLPGQGQTSHLPNGSKYSTLQTLIDLRRAIKYLNWNHFHFISHSFGGRYALLYAAIYPQEVASVIMLDYLYPAFRLIPENTIEVALKKYFQAENDLKSSSKPLNKQYALELFAAKRGLSSNAVLPMFERCIKRIGAENVQFTTDPRLKAFFPDELMNPEELFDMLRKKPINVLVISYTKSSILKTMADLHKRTEEALRANRGHFQLVEIDGNHYDHLTNPAATAKHIANFLNKFDSELVL